MKNHPLYKKLKQLALDGNYTIEQVQLLDFNKAVNLLGERTFTGTFLSNMKRGVIDALQDRGDNRNVQSLKQVTKNWLDVNFPDWKAERGRQGDKPYVTIWLEGKP